MQFPFPSCQVASQAIIATRRLSEFLVAFRPYSALFPCRRSLDQNAQLCLRRVLFGARTNMPQDIRWLFGATLRWVFRTAIALNLVRFALSFVPKFEGTAKSAGIADKLFGAYTVGTFRADFAWLIGSTMVIFLATFHFAKFSKDDPRARLDVLLGRTWTVAFVIYVIKSIFSGVLYPG